MVATGTYAEQATAEETQGILATIAQVSFDAVIQMAEHLVINYAIRVLGPNSVAGKLLSLLAAGQSSPTSAPVPSATNTQNKQTLLFDTSAIGALGTAMSALPAAGIGISGIVRAVTPTVRVEALQHGFTVPSDFITIPDSTSFNTIYAMRQELREFGASPQGFDGNAVIGATALDAGIALITGDGPQWWSVRSLGGNSVYIWGNPGP